MLSHTHESPELVRIWGPQRCFLQRDLIADNQVSERSFHGLHARASAGLDHRIYLGCPSFANETSNRGIYDQHLNSGDPGRTIFCGNELLRDYSLKGERQLDPDLLLLVGRKDVYDAVYCLRAVVCADGREYQMTRFRRLDCRGYRLQIRHYSNEDYIGILTKRGAQAGHKRLRVRAYLPLVYDGFAVLVEILYRVLQG